MVLKAVSEPRMNSERMTVLCLVLLLGAAGRCSGVEGDNFVGFLDRLVGKPRSTVNDSSTEIASEKLPAESKAIESWLKKLYDQFVAEKAGRANLEESKLPSSSLPSNAVATNQEATDSKAMSEKKTSENAGKLDPVFTSAPPKKVVYLEDLTAELDRLLKLFNEEDNKQSEDANLELARGVSSLHKIADNMERNNPEQVSLGTKSVISDDGVVEKKNANPKRILETKEATVEDLQENFDLHPNADHKESEATAPSSDMFRKSLREMSLDDLYNELKRETLMEKRILSAKANSVASAQDDAVDFNKDASASATADAVFYAQKKKELSDTLKSLTRDDEQNAGKLTNFGRRKKDDPITVVADGSVAESARRFPLLQKDVAADPVSVFNSAYVESMARFGTAKDAAPSENTERRPPADGTSSAISENLFIDRRASLFSNKRDSVSKDVRETVEAVFQDAYKKSLQQTALSVKKIFEDAYKQAMESIDQDSKFDGFVGPDVVKEVNPSSGSQHARGTEAKVNPEANSKPVEETKATIIESGANLDRKKDLIRKFLLDFASELKKESSSSSAPSKIADEVHVESERENVATKKDAAALAKDDSSIAAQRLEEIMQGFELAAAKSNLGIGRP